MSEPTFPQTITDIDVDVREANPVQLVLERFEDDGVPEALSLSLNPVYEPRRWTSILLSVQNARTLSALLTKWADTQVDVPITRKEG